MNKRITELRGMQVVGAAGRTLGEVDDVTIDLDTWSVTNLVVRVSAEAVGELGLHRPFWARARIEVPIHLVSGATDLVILRSSIEQLAQLVDVAEKDTH